MAEVGQDRLGGDTVCGIYSRSSIRFSQYVGDCILPCIISEKSLFVFLMGPEEKGPSWNMPELSVCF